MNFIDVLLLIPFCWGAYKGFKKGLIIELCGFLALALGVWGAYKFSPVASKLILAVSHASDQVAHLIGFGLVFLLIVIIVYFGGKQLEKVVKAVKLSALNKIAGAAFGGLKLIMIAGILLFILDRVDQRVQVIKSEVKEGSLLYQPVVDLQGKMFIELMKGMEEQKSPSE